MYIRQLKNLSNQRLKKKKMFKQVCISTTHDAAELIADILYDISGEGINIYDKQDLYDIIHAKDFWDYVDEEALNMSPLVQVKGYFNPKDFDEKFKELNQRLQALKENAFVEVGSLETTIENIDENAWRDEWKKTYKPIDVGQLIIVPSWIKEKHEDKVVVKMDPGLAFGSGEHESTRMCLEFMQDLNLEDKSVVDVGCGSGILAISAKALGAKRVEAYDIDDNAISATKNNSKLNNFEFKVENSNLLQKCYGEFDVVFANITSEVLKMLSRDLLQYVKKNGIVIISGILNILEDEVLEAFTKIGFKVIERKAKGEWVAFKLGR